MRRALKFAVELLLGETRSNLRERREHVLARSIPLNGTPSLELAKRIRRTPGKVISIPSPDPVQFWLDAKESAKQAEKVRENVEAVLLAYMGDAEAADTPLGQLRYLEENAGKRLDLERLKSERPEVYEEYAVPTTRRVLRLREAKKLPATPERKELVQA